MLLIPAAPVGFLSPRSPVVAGHTPSLNDPDNDSGARNNEENLEKTFHDMLATFRNSLGPLADRVTPLNDSDEKHHDGDHQKNMNESAHGIR